MSLRDSYVAKSTHCKPLVKSLYELRACLNAERANCWNLFRCKIKLSIYALLMKRSALSWVQAVKATWILYRYYRRRDYRCGCHPSWLWLLSENAVYMKLLKTLALFSGNYVLNISAWWAIEFQRSWQWRNLGVKLSCSSARTLFPNNFAACRSQRNWLSNN